MNQDIVVREEYRGFLLLARWHWPLGAVLPLWYGYMGLIDGEDLPEEVAQRADATGRDRLRYRRHSPFAALQGIDPEIQLHALAGMPGEAHLCNGVYGRRTGDQERTMLTVFNELKAIIDG